MAKVTLERRLRPIRFAFLIRPGDRKELLDVFRLNTVLWGGSFNVLVPMWRRVPSAHTGEGSGQEIVARLLDAAEPDFVVCGRADAKPLKLPPSQVLSLTEMLEKPMLPSGGLGTMPLYRWLYETEFKYVARHPHRMVSVKANDPFKLFAAARFGDVPAGPWAESRVALEQLGAKEVELNATSYVRDLIGTLSPIHIGSYGLDAGGNARTAYLLMDSGNVLDLIDYWNLRAFGWRVLPVPLAWATGMAPAVSDLISRRHQPAPPLRRDLTAGHVLKGRSVSDAAFSEFVASITAAGDRFIVQDRLPRYWQRDRWDSDHVTRPEVSARKDELEVQTDKRRISFASLPPPFETTSLWSSPSQWANVVSVRSWDLPEVAEVLPRGFDGLATLMAHGHGRESYRCTSEGITILQNWRGRSLSWQVPDGFSVFSKWWADRYAVTPSAAGRIARRLIRLLGGPEHTRVASSPPMIRVFGKASKSASKSLAFPEFWGALLREFRNHTDIASGVLERWADAGVVGMGVEIVCTECGQCNWYALNQLGTRLQCQRCLDSFSFPTAKPSAASWAIRPLGPFAVEGWAQGGFTVALTIRLLKLHGSRARTTWAPGLSLLASDGLTTEVDFAMLWHEEGPWVHPVNLILGECKTFNRFERKDALRLRAMARAFPGAYLVCSSMNEALNDEEVALLRPIAKAGRRDWRNPVIVLTANELANDFNPPTCWRSPAAAKVAEQIPPLMTLRALADATQQIHLGLPSGAGWPHPQPWE